MTMAPRPIFTSTAPWYWASSAPDRATRPLESISPTVTVTRVSIPWALAMRRLAPVARRQEPYSVPKNQYRMPMSTANVTTAGIRGLRADSSFTNRWDTTRLYLSTEMGWLDLLPMIRRFTEYRASWVRMPARMAGMPQRVCSRPVTMPASMPTRNAHSRAIQGLQPERMSIMHAAPPVARLPSTVRSATSRMR